MVGHILFCIQKKFAKSLSPNQTNQVSSIDKKFILEKKNQ